ESFFHCAPLNIAPLFYFSKRLSTFNSVQRIFPFRFKGYTVSAFFRKKQMKTVSTRTLSINIRFLNMCPGVEISSFQMYFNLNQRNLIAIMFCSRIPNTNKRSLSIGLKTQKEKKK